MKCIVTGGSGFIGSHLVEELTRRNYEVLNIDIRPPNLESHRVYWKERNILERDALIADFQAFSPDSVIHLAARTDTLSDRLEDYVSNTEGTHNILAAIKTASSVERVIICSTQFVNQYHGAPKHDLDFAPHTAYGESKVMNEKATRAANLQCLWTIIRPTNIWGPWHPRYPHEFWRVIAKGMYLHPSGGNVIRSYGYVNNVVYQLMKILESPPDLVNEKVYYLGDRPINLLDWVNGFSEGLTGRKARIVPRFLLRLIAFVGDMLSFIHIKFPITSSRFRSMTTSNNAPMEPVFDAFGESPYCLQEGIEETIAWLRDQYPDIVKTQKPN